MATSKDQVVAKFCPSNKLLIFFFSLNHFVRKYKQQNSSNLNQRIVLTQSFSQSFTHNYQIKEQIIHQTKNEKH